VYDSGNSRLNLGKLGWGLAACNDAVLGGSVYKLIVVVVVRFFNQDLGKRTVDNSNTACMDNNLSNMNDISL